MGCGVSSQEVDDNNNSNTNRQNQPLERSKNYRHGTNITQAELTNQRNEFWATRTTGSNEMWQAIHVAADALLADDLPLATAILEASSIVSSTGSLELCYDERGHRYKVPQYCYSHPIELRVADPSSGSKAPSSSSGAPAEHNSNPINLKVRLNPGDKNYVIKIMSGELVSDLKRSIAEQSCPKPADGDPADPPPASSWVHPPQRQRIMFLGRELKDQQRLCDLHLDEKKVVQVFLRPDSAA